MATATRYPELAYESVTRGLWRFVDVSTGSHVGPHYRTKAELLADLERFAAVFGCDGAAGEWTVERVKEELPAVKVYNRETREESLWDVRGRLLAFPKITNQATGETCEVAWETLVTCLNVGRPLIY